jgi:hypothetical protein
VVVPEDVSGCAVPVVVKAGDVVSNTLTVSVAENGGTCSDPLLSSTLLDLISQTGRANVGGISLSRIRSSIAGNDVTFDTAAGFFDRYTIEDVRAGAGSNFIQSIGSCIVTTYREGEVSGPGDFGTPLDAGDPLTLTTPNSGTRQLQRQTGGAYIIPIDPQNPIPAPFLDPGAYTIAGSGGPAGGTTTVGSFSQAFDVPATLEWTNEDAIDTVTRSEGVTINWTGGDPNGYVMISGSSTAADAPGSPTASFTCWERTSAGTFAVPSVILLSLPQSGAGEESTGTLMVGSVAEPERFSPLPSGLDEGYVTSTVFNSKQVAYQ